MNYDDGCGPYTFCKRGLSRCDDQTCDCVDSAHYRTMYMMERERRGWTLGRYPAMMTLRLALCGIAGAAAGGLILYAYVVLMGG